MFLLFAVGVSFFLLGIEGIEQIEEIEEIEGIDLRPLTSDL